MIFLNFDLIEISLLKKSDIELIYEKFECLKYKSDDLQTNLIIEPNRKS